MQKIKITFILFIMGMAATLCAQEKHSHAINDNKTFIRGGFGEIHYLHKLNNENSKLSSMEIPHFVLKFGHMFNDKWFFFGSVAIEEGHEVHLENLFLNYAVSHQLNIKGGLMELPMGIVNQAHMPTMYNGVKPPKLYQYIIPYEWSELAIGVKGEVHDAQLDYQAYLINGLMSYHDEHGLISDLTGFRRGRQGGHHVHAGLPSFIGRAEWGGLPNTLLGASLFAGKTLSDLYNSQPAAVADSTVLGLVMLGADVRYNFAGWQLRGEVMYNRVFSADAYNRFTSSNLGSSMLGWYTELGYRFDLSSTESYITPFVRFGKYDTQFSIAEPAKKNGANAHSTLTCGIGYRINKHIMLKADYQYEQYDDHFKDNMLNAGVSFVW